LTLTLAELPLGTLDEVVAAVPGTVAAALADQPDGILNGVRHASPPPGG
jgi:hypothetical protein